MATLQQSSSVRRAVNQLAKSACAPSSSSRPFTTSSPSLLGTRKERLDPDLELGNMGVFEYDDIPTVGHLALNRKREMLKYARAVIHNFPELEKYRRPYEPPSSDSILSIRSLHYQGAAHPAARKSVLVVSIKDLFASKAFTKMQPAEAAKAKRKFLHLAGPRWDPGEGVLAEPLRLDGNYLSNVPHVGSLKITCERFPLEKQNLKWCSDVLDNLLAEAQDTKSDEIWSLPLDTRHRIVRDQKKHSGGRRRRATIADWPQNWATEGVTPQKTQ